GAARLHGQLLPLFKAAFITTNPIPIKAALEMCGLPAGGLRPPLLAAGDSERAVIRAALAGLGLCGGRGPLGAAANSPPAERAGGPQRGPGPVPGGAGQARRERW